MKSSRHGVIFNCFWRCFFSLVNFSYWSRFHINIIASPRVMKIFVYKRLTRNPVMGSSSVWVLLNIWRLGWVRDSKFGSNVSSEMLLNIAICQGYRLYHFWVIKRKLTGGRVKISPRPRKGLKLYMCFLINFPSGKVSHFFLSLFLINTTHIFANFKKCVWPTRFFLTKKATDEEKAEQKNT